MSASIASTLPRARRSTAAATPLYRGRWYDEVVIGSEFTSAMTITDTHIALSAGLIADFNPLHVDETFARKSRYGSRILHGVITSAIMSGPVGMYFAGTAIGYLEHNARFLAPVRPGARLSCGQTHGRARQPARGWRLSGPVLPAALGRLHL